MYILNQYCSAEDLEQYLGDPCEAERIFSFKHTMELDELAEYPEQACALLQQWGFLHYFIPSKYGGKLSSYEELLTLLRVISRRDLTVAIALGQIYLGAVHIWIAGTQKQKQRVAEIIKAGKQMAFALTEREHGSDILASEVQATKTENGYLLHGEKWLINNGTRAAALTVFARTEIHGGPRGFSLFLVEKDSLNRSFLPIPKIKTLGIRGADISGVRFNNSFIPTESIIAHSGYGLEIALKGLMITRSLCAGFSLGAVDTVLRSTLGFALKRKLYGDIIFNIPDVKRKLVDSFMEVLICDCLAIAAMRALHTTPDQASIWSAIVKYFVPTTIEDTIENLCVVLGARYYLREGYQWGMVQKIARDNSVVSLFDGSTVINLTTIALQLHQLMADKEKYYFQDREELQTRLKLIFSLQSPLPDFDSMNLELSNRGCNDVLQGLEIALSQLHNLKERSNSNLEVVKMVIEFVDDMLKKIAKEKRFLQDLTNRYGYAATKSTEIFESVKRYCILHAASTCIHMWIHNRECLSDFFAKGEWLVLCLRRLLIHFDINHYLLPDYFIENVAQEAVERYQQGKAFSIVPYQLAHLEREFLQL
ncbi:MAG: acyl-CoA dehydrogenase family protein [Acidobacteriota bacterium]